MPKKMMKVVALFAALSVAFAHAGGAVNDYGIFQQPSQAQGGGVNDYGIFGK